MTEAEWLTWADPEWMLKFVQSHATERKLRLYAVACCRRIWHLLEDERSWRAVETAEAFADGSCSDQELREAHLAALHHYSYPTPILNTVRAQAAAEAAIQRTPRANRENHIDIGFPRDYPFMSFAEVVLECVRHELREWQFDRDLADQHRDDESWCLLLRDIFGNPFCPVRFSPEWRTDTAIALARQMYESRDFGAMPILADALQDAGCDNTDLLNHCRETNATHVRGCWVVDLVLGKE